MDQTLRFKQHIAAKVKTAKSMVGAIRRSFRYLDIPTFRLLYKGLSRCHLEYAVPTWSPFQEKLIEQIESIQRRAITNQLPGLISQQECQRDQTKLLLPTDNRTMELPTRPCGRSTVKKQLQRTTGQTLEKPRNRIQP